MLKARTGTVVGQSIRPNKDGSKPVRLLQVKFSPDDIQTIEQIGDGGGDFCPPNGSRVLVVPVGEATKMAASVGDGAAPLTVAGSRRINAVTANGSIVAPVTCFPDGHLELLGSGDFAVRFSALETAFNQLLDFVNTHIHTGVSTGGGSSGAPATTCEADISPAMIAEIGVP